jgi:hypothetical protein
MLSQCAADNRFILQAPAHSRNGINPVVSEQYSVGRTVSHQCDNLCAAANEGRYEPAAEETGRAGYENTSSRPKTLLWIHATAAR